MNIINTHMIRNAILAVILCTLGTVMGCSSSKISSTKADGSGVPAGTATATTDEATFRADRPHYIISVVQVRSELGNRAEENLGDIVVELFPDIAPKHCHNFDSLVSVKLYDGTVFHRVIPGFMIQGGDPNSKGKQRDQWGRGSAEQTRVPAEFNKTAHKRGILSAARSSDPNSATSQFFICVEDVQHLDNNYTAYGQVMSGMDVVDKIVNQPRDERDNPIDRIEMRIKKQ